MQDTWDTVARLVAWLDDKSAAPAGTAPLLRVLKIVEEAGEVAEAVHGVYGANPRKGNSHTWDDVRAEICDVILTGMVALRTLTPHADKTFAEHVGRVAGRSLA
ncbi:MazG-like family protein [Streptomyces fumanus]|uniref:NTP pyrophosphohydrolase MazG putative catalytic core domain-containing protein n=1 Tax=Streptomyces fumanus TaxID=67302 RepID=A0A919AG71_9ACTN|nr:MazG-like family protein [Streptomyces fumanus]GHF03022.1 hypothetical protein GCM10018772_29760 [Streptomyces fumanus]